MRIDFATLAFGYSVKIGGATPNWATSLGQSRERKYRINDNPDIYEILKGMVYTSVSLSKVSSKIGKGGKLMAGSEIDSPIILASVFPKVYINDQLIVGGRYVILVTRDTSPSHEGRLRFKYGPSNTYDEGLQAYSNEDFWEQAKRQLKIEEKACFFVYDISIYNQDELHLGMVVVNSHSSVEYYDSADLHKAWELLIEENEEKREKNSYLSMVDGRIHQDDYNQIKILTTGRNILLYGVPGSGKSWTIEHEYCKSESVVERIVFHPDYTYSDFVGQILPDVSDDGAVSYKFTPGPFTNILRESYENPDKEYILIIEEINRGNAPAIFGEIFQLLDRKVEVNTYGDDGFPIGTSVYGITNLNIAEIMYGKDRKTEKVRIPSNLSIIGTMNTSDQNVFTLDTAFQRRWDMRLIENNFNNVDSSLADAEILDTTVSWKRFCLVINKIIVGNNARMTSSEDKRIGAYFVHPSDLKYDDRMGDLNEYDILRKLESKGNLTKEEGEELSIIREAMKQNRRFPEKVIKYLWDDAFKFNREIVFDTPTYQSLEDVIHAFIYAKEADRFKIFKDDVRSSLIETVED